MRHSILPSGWVSTFLLGILISSGTFGQEPAETPKESKAKSTKPDLSIPIPLPKPLVWREDWKGVPELPAARKKSLELMEQAHLLKFDEKYKEAEKIYLASIDADPTWGAPHYMIACNYELSGKSEEASAAFDQAVKLGYDDFPTALRDEELGTIRKRPDFKQKLLEIKQRYAAAIADRAGHPIGVRPKGEAPAGGWPVILLLHGYGDTNANYLDQADLWAAQGFVAIAVPGSIPTNIAEYQWSNGSVAPTQRDVQAILKSPLLKELVDPAKVYLFGFSQGAQHAMIMILKKPSDYAGVVAVSPGGSLIQQILAPVLKETRTCVFIFGAEEPFAPVAARWQAACKKAGWRFMGKVHPGGHSLPEGWDELMPEVAKFLKETE